MTHKLDGGNRSAGVYVAVNITQTASVLVLHHRQCSATIWHEKDTNLQQIIAWQFFHSIKYCNLSRNCSCWCLHWRFHLLKQLLWAAGTEGLSLSWVFISTSEPQNKLNNTQITATLEQLTPISDYEQSYHFCAPSTGSHSLLILMMIHLYVWSLIRIMNLFVWLKWEFSLLWLYGCVLYDTQ